MKLPDGYVEFPLEKDKPDQSTRYVALADIHIVSVRQTAYNAIVETITGVSYYVATSYLDTLARIANAWNPVESEYRL